MSPAFPFPCHDLSGGSDRRNALPFADCPNAKAINGLGLIDMSAKQLRAMAKLARLQGDKASACDLSRVAKWAVTFKGWQSRPLIGPSAPSIACESARATGKALQSALDRGAPDHSAMVNVWRKGGLA